MMVPIHRNCIAKAVPDFLEVHGFNNILHTLQRLQDIAVERCSENRKRRMKSALYRISENPVAFLKFFKGSCI